jgi:hypothetical protein
MPGWQADSPLLSVFVGSAPPPGAGSDHPHVSIDQYFMIYIILHLS